MRTSLLVAVVGSATGCAEAPGRAAESFLVNDSVGIEVVTHLQVASELPVDTLSGPPLLTIGRQSQPVFHEIASVVPFADGRIVVASAGSKTIQVFDRVGSLLSSHGREGEGPGEYLSIWGALAIEPDSLLVFDNWLGRLTLLTLSGEVVRTMDVSRFLPLARGATVHLLPDAFVLVGVASVGQRRSPGAYRDSANTYLLDRAGDSLSHLGMFPGTEVMHADRFFGGLPFGGSLFSGTRDGRVVLGLSTEPELKELGPGGRVLRIVRWPDQGQSVSAERMEAFVRHQLNTVPEPERAQAAQMLDALPHSPTMPSYWDLVVASDGTIWLGDYPGPEALPPNPISASRTWTLIDRDGVRRRVVRTPQGYLVKAVTRDAVFGVQTDDMGVESVSVYRLPTPASG